MAFDVSWSQLPPVQDGRLADGDVRQLVLTRPSTGGRVGFPIPNTAML